MRHRSELENTSQVSLWLQNDPSLMAEKEAANDGKGEDVEIEKDNAL